MLVLTAVEARVLGCLMEKEITTPEYYPLSLNALVNACNQKSSREPVMELTERDVRGALSSLEDQNLVRVLADARVPKFEHRVRDGLGEPNLRRDEVAVFCLLLLRGPQTSAELRTRADRLYAFEDNTAVLGTLERLAARPEPLTRVLARQPGAREPRWRQLLTGEPDEAAAATRPAAPNLGLRPEVAGRDPGPVDSVRDLEARVLVLEERARVFEERARTLEERMQGIEARWQAAGLE